MQIGKTFGFRHVITAGEATAGTLALHTKGAQITGAVVQRRTAAGALLAAELTTVIITSPEVITLTEVTPVWAAGETFDVIFF